MHALSANITQEEANNFIVICHHNLEAVKQQVAVTAAIVNVYNPKVNETALGAAGHVGNHPIAEYLLENSAELELAAAAMLGMKDKVAEWLAKDSTLAESGGAHGISVAFHAAMSNDPEIMQMLLDNGAEEQVKNSLIGAVSKGHLKMTQWLLEHGADTSVQNYQGKSPLQVAQDAGFTEVAELLKS
ncbi:MAG: ankyrin repeat domain-containing protein [Chloroflexota bacterium]